MPHQTGLTDTLKYYANVQQKHKLIRNKTIDEEKTKMSQPAEVNLQPALNLQPVNVTSADLPLHCPTPSMKLWNSHPRVFIDVTTTGEAKCPYCGTVYKLSGPVKHGH